MLTRYVGVALTLAVVGCSKPSEEKPPAPGMYYIATSLTIDSARSPRAGAPLIAGETARIGMMIRDGIGPYHVQLQSRRLASDSLPPGPALVSAETTISAGARAEIALEAPTIRRALSGRHEIWATVRNAAGKTSTTSGEVNVIGADALVWPEAKGPEPVQVLDLLGRRRKQLVRGEPFTVRITRNEPGPFTIAMFDSRGRTLAKTDRNSPAAQTVKLSLSVPRLARPGRYTVAAAPEGSAEGHSTSFEVIGEPFAPVTKLVIDSLALYGGKDGRAPRKGILRLGEPLVVEARVGGAKAAVSGRLMVISAKGTKLIDVGIGGAKVSDPAPDARIFVHGEVPIPRGAPFVPDRYRIQVEVSEGDDVSMRTREVLIE